MTTFENRLYSSFIASGFAEMVTLPLDTAKVRLQVQTFPIKYTGTFNCIQKIAKEEGYLKCWKGATPALFRQTLYSSLSMILYEPIRNKISKGKASNFIDKLIAGGTAGSISIATFNWTEVLKTKMQTSKEPQKMFNLAKNIFRKDGLKGFFTGIHPNIARTFIVNAAELGTFDQSKEFIIPYTGDNWVGYVCASGIAGFTSACVSTPVDIIKTRMMNNSGTNNKINPLKLIKLIRNKEGLCAFYKGFGAICFRKIMWCSIFFPIYEKFCKIFGSF